jgi:hypothetical protein
MMKIVAKVNMTFFSSEGWESGDTGRMTGGGVNSMLQFQLEKGGDGMKHCQKMNQRQRARLEKEV